MSWWGITRSKVFFSFYVSFLFPFLFFPFLSFCFVCVKMHCLTSPLPLRGSSRTRLTQLRLERSLRKFAGTVLTVLHCVLHWNAPSHCAVCLFVRSFVCLCVCMYACMHVCMFACLHVCMYACMHVCMYACMHACMHVRMYVCLSVCLSVCLYVCTYLWSCAKFYSLILKNDRNFMQFYRAGWSHQKNIDNIGTLSYFTKRATYYIFCFLPN